IPATSPVTSGAEKDVPEEDPTCPLARTTLTPCPSAATSGLMRPSAVGPIELDPVFCRRLLTDPTATTPSTSAGAVMIRQLGILPSFPALVTTTIPRSLAHFAARDTTVVRPSICSRV